MDKKYYRFSIVILMTIAAALIFSGCAPKETVKPWSSLQLRKISIAFNDIDQDKNEISGELTLNRNGAPKPNGISHYVVYWSKSLRTPIQKGDKIVQNSVNASGNVLIKFGENTKIDPEKNRYFVLYLKDTSGKEFYSRVSTKLKDTFTEPEVTETEQPVAARTEETQPDAVDDPDAGPAVPNVNVVVPGAPDTPDTPDTPGTPIAKMGEVEVAEIRAEETKIEESKIEESKTTEIVPIVIGNILFAFDKSFITEKFAASLEETFSDKEDLEDIKVKIAGHADERGSNEYNLALGYRRAYAAKQYLISLGLSEENIEIISYGEQMPADSGHNEKAWAKNRRAESTIE